MVMKQRNVYQGDVRLNLRNTKIPTRIIKLNKESLGKYTNINSSITTKINSNKLKTIDQATTTIHLFKNI